MTRLWSFEVSSTSGCIYTSIPGRLRDPRATQTTISPIVTVTIVRGTPLSGGLTLFRLDSFPRAGCNWSAEKALLSSIPSSPCHRTNFQSNCTLRFRGLPITSPVIAECPNVEAVAWSPHARSSLMHHVLSRWHPTSPLRSQDHRRILPVQALGPKLLFVGRTLPPLIDQCGNRAC